jgi:transposase
LPTGGSAGSILDDTVPHHSTFSINRLDRFRESDILRHVFERVVAACMVNDLVKGEGFAVDASVMEANASRRARRRQHSGGRSHRAARP